MSNVVKNVQYVGLDVGRGYVKGYTEHKGNVRSCMFKSIYALGRTIDLSEYVAPIHVEIDDCEYFVGELAEKEGHAPSNNYKDDKTSETVEILLMTALSKIAIEDQVKVMLGVPNKLFKKSELEKIQNAYKNKTFTVIDKIDNSKKTITILDISIFREADAALMWHVNGHEHLKNGPVGMVSIGFRTTELAYFDKGLKFNDKLSDTIEFGNKTALEYVRDRLSTDNNTKHSLSIIDSSDDYDKLKKPAYRVLTEKLESEIESAWINLQEVAVFIAGGTALKLNLNHEIIEDPQMATAKGLWLIGKKKFAQ